MSPCGSGVSEVLITVNLMLLNLKSIVKLSHFLGVAWILIVLDPCVKPHGLVQSRPEIVRHDRHGCFHDVL